MNKLAPVLALALLVGCAGGDADGDGFVASVDCDDDNNLVFPGALERCDGLDNDCNNVEDDAYAAEAIVFFLDEDGDGYGTTVDSQMSCATETPAGFVANASDCDDSDNDINPGAEERCNLIDDNCNRAADDNPVDAVLYFADNDKDGFGSRTLRRRTCDAPAGWIKNGGDCNDFDFLVNPNALEFCDGYDNDCDDDVDEPDAEDHSVFYIDVDGDGFGNADEPIDACYLPDGYAVESTDCNDDPAEGGAVMYPGNEEICKDGLDNNCNDDADQCSWGAWQAGSASYEVSGDRYLGWSIDAVGDVDNDGHDDVLWGDYFSSAGSTYTGAAHLLYGEADGVITEPDLDADDLPGWHTETSYDYFGRTVSRLGDIDRDGHDDFGIGSYYYDGGASNGGTMAIVYGDSTRYEDLVNIEVEDTPSLVSRESSAYLGSAMGPAGDLNKDGFVDMLVGAYYQSYDGNFGAGSVYAVPGASSRYSHESDVGTFGRYVGDERYFYLGYTGDSLGSGDLDADGDSDIAMGAYGYSSYAGGAFIIYGDGALPTGTQEVTAAADAVMSGSSSSQYVGGFLTDIPGDINDDGYDDLIVGHYRANNYGGACYIYFGGTTELRGGAAEDRADITINGRGSSTYLCRGRAVVADFNNDDSPELVVGAYRDNSGSGTYNGAAYLFEAGSDFGTDEEGNVIDTYDALDADEVIEGSSGSYGYFGSNLAGGDFNGDGYDDLFVGEYGQARGHVFLGNSL